MKKTVARTLGTVERVYNLIEKIISMKMLYLWYMREMGEPTSRFRRLKTNRIEWKNPQSSNDDSFFIEPSVNLSVASSLR